MKKLVVLLGLAVSLAVFSIAVAEEMKVEAVQPKTIVVASPDKGTYTEMVPGVTRSVVWGDPTKGAHATYTKFSPGFDAGMHTHTHDVWIVVIKGAYLYRDAAGDKKIGPGEFIRVAAAHPHWSGGDAKEGALFYQESDGSFDLIPAKK